MKEGSRELAEDKTEPVRASTDNTGLNGYEEASGPLLAKLYNTLREKMLSKEIDASGALAHLCSVAEQEGANEEYF